jgi:PTS system nitrogen regulatory IIA component
LRDSVGVRYAASEIFSARLQRAILGPYRGTDVRLADLLTIDRVRTDLDVRDKAAALRALAELFADAERGGHSVDDTVHALLEREALASTGVGSGVAIPHGRLTGLDKTVASLAIAPKGLEFEAIDGEPVHILVCILAPRDGGTHGASDHLKALARISRALRSELTRARLRESTSPQAALDALLHADA